MKHRYDDSVCDIIKLMLKSNECDRPSFVELASLALITEQPDVTNQMSANEKERLI